MSAPEPLRAVLLDLDGTMLDPGRGVSTALTAATASLGLPSPGESVLRRFIGPPIQEGFATLLGLNPCEVRAAVTAFRTSYAIGGLYDFDVYPGVPEMLSDLSAAGLRLAVATSKPEVFAVSVLRHAGLLSAFELVQGATLDGAVRYKAQVVAAALDRLAVPAGQAVLLGDRAEDAAGAWACGTGCIGAGWGYGEPGELQAAGVEAVAGRPSEVLRLLRLPEARATR